MGAFDGGLLQRLSKVGRICSETRLNAGKWEALQKICEEMGVIVRPKQLDGVWIVPILSWYHASWDTEPEIPGSTPIDKVALISYSCITMRGKTSGGQNLFILNILLK